MGHILMPNPTLGTAFAKELLAGPSSEPDEAPKAGHCTEGDGLQPATI